jgi:gas vesicle protein
MKIFLTGLLVGSVTGIFSSLMFSPFVGENNRKVLSNVFSGFVNKIKNIVRKIFK